MAARCAWLAVALGVTDAFNPLRLTGTFSKSVVHSTKLWMSETDGIVDTQTVLWKDPREGQPFGTEGVRLGTPSFQPRGITDGTIADKQYIETEDEPWHFTSRGSVFLTKTEADTTYAAALPFMDAETTLTIEASKAKDAGAMKAALKEALASGARDGSPAVAAVLKGIAAMEKDPEKAKNPVKAPKDPAQGNGWDNMKRVEAKTHDNSI